MVTISVEEYNRLREAEQDLLDLQVIDRVTADIAAGREELIPAEYVHRLIDGESPLRVWRDFRGLTQMALAEASGVNRVQIADIEAWRKTGSVDTLANLAGALRITIDDLV